MAMSNFLDWILLGLPSFILAGTVHEYMHAWTAQKLGDFTARTEGRLTLNPLDHLDPIGTIMMIFARFGWMKPVPVNEYNFENRVQGMAITAAAGPASNLVMALLASFIYRSLAVVLIGSTSVFSGYILLFLYIFTWVNVALMLFNLIPIPPLDGYRILRAFLPTAARYYWEQLEQYSVIILVLLFIPYSPLSSITTTFLSAGVGSIINLLLF